MAFAHSDISRRRFQTYAAACLASGFLTGPTLGLAQDVVAESISLQIGKSFAGAAGKQFGALAFGQILSFAGVSDPQAEIINLLGQIIDTLKTIEAQVSTLQRQLEQGLSVLNYSDALAPVLPLIAANRSILAKYNVLINGSPLPAEVDVIKGVIKGLITPVYQSGLETLHAAIVGSSTQLGLIQSWSNLVRLKGSPLFFTYADAQRIQQQWDFIDGHQALVATTLSDYYKARGAPTLAKSVIQTWYDNRAAQLALLRGCTNRADVFVQAVMLPGNQPPDWNAPQSYSVTTPLNYVPQRTMVDKSRPLMWYTLASRDDTTFWQANRAIDMQPALDTGLPLPPYRAPSGDGNHPVPPPRYDTPWRPLTIDEFMYVARACGGDVGSGHNDHFVAQLNACGFRINFNRIYVSQNQGPVEAQPNVFNENDNWWNPSTDPADRAARIYVRSTIRDDPYWYNTGDATGNV